MRICLSVIALMLILPGQLNAQSGHAIDTLYPETLPFEASQLAKYPELARRDNDKLTIYRDGKISTILESKCTNTCSIWLFSGVIKLEGPNGGLETFATVRYETGKGGRQAIIDDDGHVFWTEGPASASPNGHWIIAGADWGDQMDDSAANNSIWVYDWEGKVAPIHIKKSCVPLAWKSNNTVLLDCGDYEAKLSRAGNSWLISKPQK